VLCAGGGDTEMPASLVTYFDYKSPYAFLANKLIQQQVA
jgi:2-hydroxychromene-2-carboxylate isomerase